MFSDSKIKNNFDLIILGSGPAGLTASIYASRYAIKNLVIGKVIGGTASEAIKIENWLGQKSMGGAKWAAQAKEHVESLGGVILNDAVKSIEKTQDGFKVETETNEIFKSKTLLIASGMERKRLKVEGEERLAGRGVSYCATCDGPFFRDKAVAVVGGGDSAATAALYLTDIAKHVYIIARSGLKAEEVWRDRVMSNNKIEIIPKNTIKEFCGKKVLGKVILNNEYKGGNELQIDGAFIETGANPTNHIIESLGIEKDEKDYIKVANNQSTNIPGIWAAGDITSGSNNFRQMITACAEGAIAVNAIHEFLKKN